MSMQGHKFKKLPQEFRMLLKEIDEAMELFHLHMRDLIYDSKRETKVAIAWSQCAPQLHHVHHCAQGRDLLQKGKYHAQLCVTLRNCCQHR